MKFKFPKDLYCDVRIEDTKRAWYSMQNDEILGNGETCIKGAMIRIFDGKLWYTAETNDIDKIQKKIEELAKLATPNPKILENPIVKNLSVNKASVLKFQEKKSFRSLTAKDKEDIVNYYRKKCIDKSIEEIKVCNASFFYISTIKELYTSKGTEIIQDYQRGNVGMWFQISGKDNITFGGGERIYAFDFKGLKGREEEIIEKRDRTLDFAKNNIPVTPGDYVCVLSPSVTSVFTHESFGHKSEADLMLNDKTLRDEWTMGKQVANPKVSIIDEGDNLYHGYCPYDDEGNKKKDVYLIKDGILSGRLHDAKSAAILGEEPTGNARAQDYNNAPMVRMTNTYMLAGPDKAEDIIKGVKDGIYVYDWNYGTGNSTFTIQPQKCYRIRDGKICEPLRVNVVTGNVFQTLFDIDAVGDDLQFFSGTCGKNGQELPTATGGPTIRVKKLTIN